ncbi:MAG TPA: cell division protein FtsQ/DivIB [Pseudolabrys sp.]|nr:cell division protein FtsQ/DivIB [Pseudolabrys sp.]
MRAVRARLRSTRFGRQVYAAGAGLAERRPCRGCGVLAVALLLAGTGIYGAVKGDHIETLAGQWHQFCDAGASAIGFRISEIALTGDRQLSRSEVFAAAGLTESSSLPFFDVAAARERLLAVPWIADATLRKFYPGKLEIEIKEREAFARWQRDGKVFVIAADGAVLQPYDSVRFDRLPLVVGIGAAKRAQDFLALIEHNPQIAPEMRAAVLVAERRWNLYLKNGVIVRLPEDGVAQALDTLVRLDAERNLMSRDITVVDLRLPDRVSVRLSDAAAQARADALKDKKKPRKGGDA